MRPESHLSALYFQINRDQFSLGRKLVGKQETQRSLYLEYIY